MIYRLLQRDFKSLLYNQTKIYNNLVFTVLISIIFIILLPDNIDLISFVAINLIILLFSNILNIDHILQHDYQNTTLEQLVLLGKTPMSIIIAKFISYLSISIINFFTSLFISSILFKVHPLVMVHIYLNLIPSLLLICSFLFLITAITLKLNSLNNNILSAILLLPLIIPVLILSIKVIQAIYISPDPQIYRYFLSLIISICFILIPLIIIMSSTLLKDSLNN